MELFQTLCLVIALNIILLLAIVAIVTLIVISVQFTLWVLKMLQGVKP